MEITVFLVFQSKAKDRLWILRQTAGFMVQNHSSLHTYYNKQKNVLLDLISSWKRGCGVGGIKPGYIEKKNFLRFGFLCINWVLWIFLQDWDDFSVPCWKEEMVLIWKNTLLCKYEERTYFCKYLTLLPAIVTF